MREVCVVSSGKTIAEKSVHLYVLETSSLLFNLCFRAHLRSLALVMNDFDDDDDDDGQ